MLLQNNTKSIKYKENPLTELLNEDVKYNKQSVNSIIPLYPYKRDGVIILTILAMGALCMVPVWNINLWQPPRTTIGDGGVGGSMPSDAMPAPDSGIGGSPVRD